VAFTPGPPRTSGGAVYAGALLPALAEHVDTVAVSPAAIEWDGPTLAFEGFEPAPGDLLLHFLGNNPEHLFAYVAALQWGGVAVCHDVAFHHVLRGFAPGEERADMAVQLGHPEAARVLGRWDRGVTGMEEFLLPVIARPLRRAEAVVVHSRYAGFMIQAEAPGVPVHLVSQHAGAVPEVDGTAGELRTRLGLPADAFVAGLFGYLGGHKRVHESLLALAAARPRIEASGRRLHVVLVGAAVGLDPAGLLASVGLADVATVTGAVDDRRFFEHLVASDVVLNLRYPTMGESSATMMQAMSCGKPVITTDHAQFAEEKAAVRVPVGDGEVAAIADAVTRLATCAACYDRVSAASLARAAEGRIDRVVDRWLGIVDSILRARVARA
jgi:glycosyltransferase involved in cell wall biosynthesis